MRKRPLIANGGASNGAKKLNPKNLDQAPRISSATLEPFRIK